MRVRRSELVALCLCVCLVTLLLATSAWAGVKLTKVGNYCLYPEAGTGGTVWCDGGDCLVYDGADWTWVSEPPPQGNGYYELDENPSRSMTFTADGDYQVTGGYGTYKYVG